MHKIKLALLLALLGCSPAFATIAYVNSGHTHCATVTSCTASYTPTNASDLLVVYVIGDGVSGQTLSSITDTNGTPSTAVAFATYTHSTTYAGVGLYYEAAATSGAHSIDVTLGASGNINIWVMEFSGVATTSPFDAATAVNSSASTTATSATLTPASANELVLGFANATASGVTFSAWSSSLTQTGAYSAAYPSDGWAYVVQTTATGATSNYTLSGSNMWTSFAAAFKAASGGSSCSNPGVPQSATAFAIPTASSTIVRLKNGTFGTVDCSTVSYKQQAGIFGVN